MVTVTLLKPWDKIPVLFWKFEPEEAIRCVRS